MERPQVEYQPKQRNITGEVMYLDMMRRFNQAPKPFLELSDMAIQLYESEADMFTDGKRPDIMDDYEHYDNKPSKVAASCIALANTLLALKETDSPLSFIDIEVATQPEVVLLKLGSIAAGSLLARDDEQLAITSNGDYYPVLDLRKRSAKLVGVSLRAWGWDDQKYIFTNKDGEEYLYPDDVLFYPSDEKNSTRQLELSFSYQDTKSGGFSESVSLFLTSSGSTTMSSQIFANAYAETGYEGHNGSSLDDLVDDDSAAFGDLIAEIVGDTPTSIAMRTRNQLQGLTDAASTPHARQAIHDLIAATWPTQANYLLNRPLKGTGMSIAELLVCKSSADAAAATVQLIIEEWKMMR